MRVYRVEVFSSYEKKWIGIFASGTLLAHDALRWADKIALICPPLPNGNYQFWFKSAAFRSFMLNSNLRYFLKYRVRTMIVDSKTEIAYQDRDQIAIIIK